MAVLLPNPLFVRVCVDRRYPQASQRVIWVLADPINVRSPQCHSSNIHASAGGRFSPANLSAL